MITADQLVAHAIGDYVLQSDWMASNKTKRSLAALCHVAAYAIPFLFFRPSALAMTVIVGTHFVIDRWRLARFVVWMKNLLAPVRIVRVDNRETARQVVAEATAGFSMVWLGSFVVASVNYQWSKCSATGYPPDTPAWLAVWLLIIADNVLHVLINGLALKYL
jgi:hypothetical protein